MDIPIHLQQVSDTAYLIRVYDKSLVGIDSDRLFNNRVKYKAVANMELVMGYAIVYGLHGSIDSKTMISLMNVIGGLGCNHVVYERNNDWKINNIEKYLKIYK